MNKTDDKQLAVEIETKQKINTQAQLLARLNVGNDDQDEQTIGSDDEQKGNNLVDPIDGFANDALNQAGMVASFDQQAEIITNLKALQIINLLTMTNFNAFKQKGKLGKQLINSKNNQVDLFLKSLKVLGADDHGILCSSSNISDFNQLEQLTKKQICDTLAIKQLYVIDAKQIKMINQGLKAINYQKHQFGQIAITTNDDDLLKLARFSNL